jgi:hypothetical protein
MELQLIKYHTCTLDKGDGILLVDIETETIPRTDRRGNRLYYCTHGCHVFAVDEQGRCILCNSKRLLLLPAHFPEDK